MKLFVSSQAAKAPRTEVSLTRILIAVAAACVPCVILWIAFQYDGWSELSKNWQKIALMLPLAASLFAALVAIILPLLIRFERENRNVHRIRIVALYSLPLAQMSLGLAGLFFTLKLSQTFVDIWQQAGFLTTQSLPVTAYFLFVLLLFIGSLRLLWTGVAISRSLWLGEQSNFEHGSQLALINARKVASVSLAVILPVALLICFAALSKISMFWFVYEHEPAYSVLDSYLIAQFVAPMVTVLLLFSPVYRFARVLGWKDEPDADALPFRMSKVGVVQTLCFVLLTIGLADTHNWIVREKLITGVWPAVGPAAPINEPYRLGETEYPANGLPRMKWTPPTPDGCVLMTESLGRVWAIDQATSNARLLTSFSGNVHPIIENGTTPFIREENNVWLETAPVRFGILPRHPELPQRRINTVTGRAILLR